jgi:hypothetical protein
MDPRLILVALGAVYFGARFVGWLKRRGRMREFAAAAGLQFRGTLPSDKYDPYRGFQEVKWSVLLYNVIEGRSDGFETAVFDYYASRARTSMGVIMSLPTDSSSVTVTPSAPPAGLGPRTVSQLALNPSVHVVTNAGHLLIRAPRKLDGDPLREFLRFVAAVARALEADHGVAR